MKKKKKRKYDTEWEDKIHIETCKGKWKILMNPTRDFFVEWPDPWQNFPEQIASML